MPNFSTSWVAVETATTRALGDLDQGAELYLVLTPERARTLKIRQYTPDIVALPLALLFGVEAISYRLADAGVNIDNKTYHTRTDCNNESAAYHHPGVGLSCPVESIQWKCS